MTRFVWKRDYEVGDPMIDCQHQYLFELANRLVGARDKEVLTDAAMKLFRYVREHFRHEEAVMRAIAYPEYTRHLGLHEKLIEQLTAIGRDIHDDRWSNASLQQFMENWLCVHILEEDRKLGRFIRR